jgi:hypothetical protein
MTVLTVRAAERLRQYSAGQINIRQMPHKIEFLLEETDRKMQVEKSKLIRELRQNQRQLETDSLGVTELLPSLITNYQALELTVDAYDEVCIIDRKLTELRNKQDKFSSHEKLFEFDVTPCKILTKLVEEFTPLKILWTLADQWLLNSSNWLDSPFSNTKPDQINSFLIQAGKQVNKLKKDLQIHPVLVQKVLLPLADQIEKFKQQLPLVARLRHPGIKTAHWEMIRGITGLTISLNDLTLQDFLNLDLGRWTEQIVELATTAAN